MLGAMTEEAVAKFDLQMMDMLLWPICNIACTSDPIKHEVRKVIPLARHLEKLIKGKMKEIPLKLAYNYSWALNNYIFDNEQSRSK